MSFETQTAARMPWADDRPPRVLACEDDPVFQVMLKAGLQAQGLPLTVISDGGALEAALASLRPEILLLDLGLPGEDGLSIARRLRRRHPRLGIVMITSRGLAEDRLQGFQEGADLYFVKPVDLRVLGAAIQSLARRLAPAPPEGAWFLHGDRSVLATPNGGEVVLTHNEHLFLNRLLRDRGTVVGRDELMAALGYAPDPEGAHRLETLLTRLRKKVRDQAMGEALPIRARHGSGYAFLE
ncbi:MAG: response regulator transcription factor [Acidobacteria bacterium]|nr:response regulator transcription factor [Acidobacteriota bacterium]